MQSCSSRLLPLPLIRMFVAFSSSTPKPSSKVMVTLLDLKGKIIGTMTKSGAEALAAKDRLTIRRYKEPGVGIKNDWYQLYDPKSELDDEPVSKRNESLSKHVSMTKGSKRPATVREKKKVTFGANISNHDVETKAKLVSKFLKANCEVQVLVYGPVSNERLEEIYKLFEKLFTGLRIVQKVLKPASLKFTVLPDPENFTGVTPLDGSESENRDLDQEKIIAEAKIDDKELEELIQQQLDQKKKL